MIAAVIADRAAGVDARARHHVRGGDDRAQRHGGPRAAGGRAALPRDLYNLQGATPFAVIVPLGRARAGAAQLHLPRRAARSPPCTKCFLMFMSVGLYGVFLAIQTLRHRQYFVGPARSLEERAPAHRPAARGLSRHAARALYRADRAVEDDAVPIDYGVRWRRQRWSACLVAVLNPSRPSPLAARRRSPTSCSARSICCSARCCESISLTIPAGARRRDAGRDAASCSAWNPVDLVLLGPHVSLEHVTEADGRTNILLGAVHILLFGAYIVLASTASGVGEPQHFRRASPSRRPCRCSPSGAAAPPASSTRAGKPGRRHASATAMAIGPAPDRLVYPATASTCAAWLHVGAGGLLSPGSRSSAHAVGRRRLAAGELDRRARFHGRGVPCALRRGGRILRLMLHYHLPEGSSTISRWKILAKKMRLELYALYLAARHPQTALVREAGRRRLRRLRRALVDLFPDALPILGIVDDLCLRAACRPACGALRAFRRCWRNAAAAPRKKMAARGSSWPLIVAVWVVLAAAGVALYLGRRNTAVIAQGKDAAREGLVSLYGRSCSVARLGTADACVPRPMGACRRAARRPAGARRGAAPAAARARGACLPDLALAGRMLGPDLPSGAPTSGRRCDGSRRPAGTKSARSRSATRATCSPTSSLITASFPSTSAASWTSRTSRTRCASGRWTSTFEKRVTSRRLTCSARIAARWPRRRREHSVVGEALPVGPSCSSRARRRRLARRPAGALSPGNWPRQRRAAFRRLRRRSEVVHHADRCSSARRRAALQPEPDQAMTKEAPAMMAPSAPPAITSLG